MTDQLLKTLAIWNAPIGPMGDIDAILSQKRDWMEKLSKKELPALVEILSYPSDELEGKGYNADDIYFEASEALGEIGKRMPIETLTLLGTLADVPHAFTAIFDTIAGMGNQEGIGLLENIYSTSLLNEAEIESLVGALGANYNEKADFILQELKKKYKDSKKVRNEIEIAYRNL